MSLIEMRMPKPGEAIGEAVLIEMYVPDGGQVTRGAPLYRIETEKVEMDIEAPVTGTVTCLVEIGIEYPVGTLLATIARSPWSRRAVRRSRPLTGRNST